MARGKADANVILGADISQFSTAMQNMSRQMSKVGREMQAMGSTLTRNLTVPLGLLGAAALKSFMDIDALKRGLVSVTGSAAGAETEFAKLRDVAKLPGIGLEEAVRGSINLQAIGVSADDARKAMKAFGNAIATVGGGRENFDLAIRGFSQLTNAARPLQQDLYQIANQLPQVNKLMVEAFGTNRAEDLAKMGMSGKDLANFLVDGLGKLPPVVGGLKNSFDNFLDTIKISLADLGGELEKTLDVSGLLDKVARSLQGLVGWYKAMSDEMKTFVSWAAIAFATAGPLMLGIAAIIKIVEVLKKSIVGLKALFASLAVEVVAFGAIGVWVWGNWAALVDMNTVALKRFWVMFKTQGRGSGKGIKDATTEFITLGEAIKKATSEYHKEKETTFNPQNIDGNGETKKTGGGLTKYELEAIAKAAKEKDDLMVATRSAETENIRELEALDREALDLTKDKINREYALLMEGVANKAAANAIDEANTQMHLDKLNEQKDAEIKIINDKIEEARESWQRSIEEFAATLRQGAMDAIYGLSDALGQAMAGVDMSNFGQNMLAGIGGFMQKIGGMLISLGIASEAFQALLKSSFFSPVAAVAAIAVGAALVAGGAAIKATAKQGPNGSGGGGNGGSYTPSSYSSGDDTLNIKLSGTLSGHDIVLASLRYEKVKRR